MALGKVLFSLAHCQLETHKTNARLEKYCRR